MFVKGTGAILQLRRAPSGRRALCEDLSAAITRIGDGGYTDLVALMASFLLCDAATARAEDLPDELWAPQAQPATFQIEEVVHVEGQRPKTISLADSLLEQNVGAGAGADIYWQAIANNPSEYLAPSQDMEAISEDDLSRGERRMRQPRRHPAHECSHDPG